ncbi:MAG: type II secretion system F family protein [Gammaproteobacteria bacterium]|nr:type II secretion system F family protein [Gammaproteobacteria bacterium]
MTTYIWTGLNRDGIKLSGIETAANHLELKNNLLKQNIFPLKIKLRHTLNLQFYSKIKTKQITLFIEQLTILINANIPLIRALNIIIEDNKNTKLKDLIISCRHSISEGKTLHQSLRQHPQYFTSLACGIIDAGEQSGTLDIMLSELTNYLKKNEEQNRKIIKALLYPCTILAVTILVTTILLIFVIPGFATMFNDFGAKIPTYTQIIINLSKLMQQYWGVILSGLIILIISSKIAHHRSILYRNFLEKISLKLPLIKNILIYAIIYRLTKTLSLTLKAGIPLLTAINISTATISNLQYKLALQKTASLITNGKSLHHALQKQNLFPDQVIQLIALGEETGALDIMLEKVSAIYNKNLNNLTDNLNNLLEPLIMIIMGILVGGLVIGMYLPLLRLGTII